MVDQDKNEKQQTIYCPALDVKYFHKIMVGFCLLKRRPCLGYECPEVQKYIPKDKKNVREETR